MYTLMVAEDELLVRIGIASCIPTDELGIRLVGVAEDGVSALEMYEEFQPDLLITDLRMPRMGGMELLRRIQATGRKCAAIVITNVDDDTSQLQARALGVTGFLLKATMKKEDIRGAILQAIRSLPLPASQPDLPDDALGWQRLLDGRAPEKSVALSSACTIVMYLFPDEKLLTRLKKSIVDMVKVELYGHGRFSLVQRENMVWFLFSDAPEASKEIRRSLDHLQWFIQDKYYVFVGFAVINGSMTATELTRIQGPLQKLLREPALFRLGLLSLSPEGKWLEAHIQSVRSKYGEYSFLALLDPLIGENLRSLQDYPGDLLDGTEAVRARGAAILARMGRSSGSDDLFAVHEAVCTALDEAIDGVLENYRPPILKALQYIQKHVEEDLPISRVAKVVGYQSKYFSRVFKSEVHLSYTELINMLRIHKAQRLLQETSLSLMEICAACGFQEIPYFCYKFKQYTGCTTKQWREQR